MLREDKKPAVIAQEAKNQILNRRYADRRLFTTDTITAVALVIDKAKNKIVMHDTMELKKYDVLEKPIHVSEISSDE
jgi:polyhydroxyalkanoate synthesis regulator protein